MTLPTDVPSPEQSYPPVARRSRRAWRRVLAIVAVLVVGIALLVYFLAVQPRLERRSNIDAMGEAFDGCGLGVPDGHVGPIGVGGAEIDRENGRITFSQVGWEPTLGPDGEPVLDQEVLASWSDVECVGEALGLPDEVLATIQEPGSESFGLDEGYRWGPYWVTWHLSVEGNNTGKNVSFLHDWQAEMYED